MQYIIFDLYYIILYIIYNAQGIPGVYDDHPFLAFKFYSFFDLYIYCITPLAWVEIQCFALTAYCLHAYMPTCLHAYMLTCLHAYMLTYLHV